MKSKYPAVTLFFGLCANAVLAQAPAAPAPPPQPAQPEPPAVVAPAAPSLPPNTPVAPAAPATPAVVDGTLFGSQRVTDDRGKYQWICTYRVAGAKRSVQLDEGCPSTMPFQLKR